MIANYFKIAWRNLLKNKIFSFINVAGLAIGLCCFIMIALYVTDELSYDRFHEKADRIYRIHSDIRFGGTDLKLAVSADPTGPVLKKDYPQVEQYARIYASDGSKHIKKGKEYIVEDNVAYADSTLFDVFTLPAIAGNTKTALDDPNTVVISESAARKYFGTTDAVGKSNAPLPGWATSVGWSFVTKEIPTSITPSFSSPVPSSPSDTYETASNDPAAVFLREPVFARFKANICGECGFNMTAAKAG